MVDIELFSSFLFNKIDVLYCEMKKKLIYMIKITEYINLNIKKSYLKHSLRVLEGKCIDIL